jgi:hypothetical protein
MATLRADPDGTPAEVARAEAGYRPRLRTDECCATCRHSYYPEDGAARAPALRCRAIVWCRPINGGWAWSEPIDTATRPRAVCQEYEAPDAPILSPEAARRLASALGLLHGPGGR